MARKISVEIIGDSKSLERAFKRSGASADDFSAKVNQGTRSIAKGAAFASGALAGMAIVAGVKAVQAASNLGEQINKVGVVFGKSAGQIKQWATTTAASIGISNRAALEAAGTFGNMLVPMGFARSQAAGMSKRLVQLAADMASFNNASPEETLDALRAGLAGETEPLRRFGVFLNQDRIKAEALSKGIVKTTKDLTKIKLQTIKVDEAQQDVVKSTKKYGVQSKETQKAIANAEYAQDQLSKALKGTVPSLTAQQKAQATYSILLKDTVDAQGDFKETSGSLPNLMRSIRASVEDLSAAFGEGLLPVVEKVAKNLQQNLADPAFREKVRELGRVIGQFLFKAIENIGRWFDQNWEGIKNAFRTGADLADKLADAVGRVYDWLKKISSVTPGGDSTLFGVILSGLLLSKVNALNKKFLLMSIRLAPIVAAILAIEKFQSEGFGGTPHGLKGLIPGYGWLWGNPNKKKSGQPVPPPRTSGVQPRAHGGPVMPGVSYKVGERGPETFVPAVGGRIIPNGGGGSIVVPVYLDGREIARVITPHLTRNGKSVGSQTRGRHGGNPLAAFG